MHWLILSVSIFNTHRACLTAYELIWTTVGGRAWIHVQCNQSHDIIKSPITLNARKTGREGRRSRYNYSCLLTASHRTEAWLNNANEITVIRKHLFCPSFQQISLAITFLSLDTSSVLSFGRARHKQLRTCWRVDACSTRSEIEMAFALLFVWEKDQLSHQ